MKPIENAKYLDESSRRQAVEGEALAGGTGDRAPVITLVTMCLVTFMTNFDGTAVDVALPQMQNGLGANLVDLQWLINAYNLPVASLLLASGSLGDRYGRRRLFLLGLGLFTVASGLCGGAPHLPLLMAGRVLQGVGAAALIPLALTILTAAFPDPPAKTKAIGIWSAVSALALVAGPGWGGWLVDNWGWRSIFLLNVPLGLLAWGLTVRMIRVDHPRSSQHLDLPGLACSLVAIASLTYALTQGLIWLSVTGLSLVGFWLVESRCREPLVPLALLRNQSFVVINIAQALVFFTSGSLLFIFSLFLQQVQGYSATATGMRFLPMNGAMILAAFLSGWVAARLGWRFPVISGLTLAGVATLALSRLQADTAYGEVLWSLTLAGFGGGLTIAPLTTAAMNAVSQPQEGVASAIFNLSIQLGGILGIAMQGNLLAHQMTAALRRSLSHLPLPLQDRIISHALHNLTDLPPDLPTTVAPLVLRQAIQQAFMAGLQATVWVAGLALWVAALLIAIDTPARLKGRSAGR